jgi:hypothetical protein
MSAKNLTIAVLTITGGILLAALVLVHSLGPQPALALAQVDRAGDYLVATGQLQRSTEYVYIVDAAVGRLNVYALDFNRKQLQLIDTFDLRTQLGGRQP